MITVMDKSRHIGEEDASVARSSSTQAEVDVLAIKMVRRVKRAQLPQ
jgi:hypothetical protein